MAEGVIERVSHYILDGSDQDLRRLLSIAERQAETARTAFRRGSVQQGWKAIDCGCGPLGGLAVLAEMVGPAGRVVGVDVSQAAVQRAVVKPAPSVTSSAPVTPTPSTPASSASTPSPVSVPSTPAPTVTVTRLFRLPLQQTFLFMFSTLARLWLFRLDSLRWPRQFRSGPLPDCVLNGGLMKYLAQIREFSSKPLYRILTIAVVVFVAGVSVGCTASKPSQSGASTGTPSASPTSILTPNSAPNSTVCISRANGSCGPYNSYSLISGTTGNVTVGNDVWSPPSGNWSQTLNVTSPGNWNAVANFPAGQTRVHSFPNTGQDQNWINGTNLPALLSSWSSMLSSYSVNLNAHSGTVAEAAYDLWLDDWKNEVMIQTDFAGDSLRPRCDVLGDVVTKQTFGGADGVPVRSWNLCQFGSELIWQPPTGTNYSSGKVNVMAMLTWLENHGDGKYLPVNPTLTAISFGVEICSTGGQNETFHVSNFSFTATPASPKSK